MFGVRQPGQRGAFALEALLSGTVEYREVDELDGGVAFEAAVAAPGQPHRAHPAAAERVLQHICADGSAGQAGAWIDRLSGEKILGHRRLVRGQQFGQNSRHRRTFAPQTLQKPCTVARVQVEYLVEQRTNERPGLGIDAVHGASW